jgi:hypothetical protein
LRAYQALTVHKVCAAEIKDSSLLSQGQILRQAQDKFEREKKMETGKKQAKKSSLILTLIVLISFICGLDAAGYSGGSGTAEDPYQIADVNDLLALGGTPTDYNKCFILTADINMGGQVFTTAVIARDTYSSNDIFDGNAFTGVFDGAGHKILNLTIDTNGIGNDYLGLFGCISSNELQQKGKVRNLGIENVSVKGRDMSPYIGGTDYSDNVGGLVGLNNDGSISNCYSTGCWACGYTGVGGLVGSNGGSISDCYSTGWVGGQWGVGGLAGGSGGSISNCYSTGIASVFYYDNDTPYLEGIGVVGGLVGSGGGNISDCYSRCNVSSSFSTNHVGFYSMSLGGLVGQFANNSIISNCYSTGNVNGGGGYSLRLGGLVGFIDVGGLVNNCYSTGAVSGDEYVGGLVGWNHNTITNCYSTGTVSGSQKVGGLVGWNTFIVSGSFWDVNTSGWMTSYGGTGKTTAEMKTRSTFTDAGWDIVSTSDNWQEHVWTIKESIDYPKLVWSLVGPVVCSDDVNAGDCVGPGDEITYRIDYNYPMEPNIGDINDVNLIDKLSEEVEFISASGDYNRPDSNTVVWNIGTLHPGDAGYVMLKVRVKGSTLPCERIRNKCELRSGEQILRNSYEYTAVCGNPNVVDNFNSYATTNALEHVWKDYWYQSAPVTRAVVSLEYTIVRDGNSMRYDYTNSASPYYSEARADVNTARPNGLGEDPNWLGMGAKALVLWFYGQAGNDANEQMYVKLTDRAGVNGKVKYPLSKMNDIREPEWQEWNIDLALFAAGGVNLADVNIITIGFGDGTTRGTGRVYFEDIRLCGECYAGMADYAQWVEVNKPTCWCYPRQCHGDADGKKQGGVALGYWYVGSNDLDILSACWLVKDPPEGPGILNIPPVNGVPVACADFKHDRQGGVALGYYRCGSNDLDEMSLYWLVKEPTKGPGIPSNCLPGNRNP